MMSQLLQTNFECLCLLHPAVRLDQPKISIMAPWKIFDGEPPPIKFHHFYSPQIQKILWTRAKSEDMFLFFKKMSLFPGPFLDILGQFSQFFGHFWPNYQKMYLTWLFTCKKVERNWKNWAKTKNDKIDPQSALKRTQSQKWLLKWVRVAKFGWNASQGT